MGAFSLCNRAYDIIAVEKNAVKHGIHRRIGMSTNSFYLYDMWNKMAEKHKPLLSFENAGLGFAEWKEKALDRLLSLLGEFPEKVDLEAVTEYSEERDGYIRRKVVFNVDEYMAVPCYVLVPKNRLPGEKLPAIVCLHGHGPFGKDPVAGIRGDSRHAAEIAEYNYNYGEIMAREGFVTICPDLRGFGERREFIEATSTGRDLCNINFIKGAMFGVYTLTLNVWDARRCIDYLETMDEVDPSRIGIMGLSYGGTVTTFTSAVEPRIKATDIIGYVNPFSGFAIGRANFCGSQMVPDLYRYFDTCDIAGLTAPRPLLLEMGICDHCFYYKDLHKGYLGTKAIYEAAGAGDLLYADVHDGGHAFSGKLAPDFFKKYL